MTKHPEIRISRPWLLMSALEPYLRKPFAESGDEEMLTNEFLEQKAQKYREIWAKYDAKIVPAMCEMFDLEFNQNIIDAYVAPLGNSFSDQLVIATRTRDERLVGVLTHELLHRLLTDNQFYQTSSGGDELRKSWEKPFGDEHTINSLIHIPVHAGLKAIYLDVLHEPEKLDLDIAVCEKHYDYRKAWEYVNAHDYREIITDVRKVYGEMKKEKL